MQSSVDKQGDTISKVKEDTAAIRETGAGHTTALSALTSEAGMQSAFREKAISDEDAKYKAEVLKWLSDLDFAKQQQSHILNYTEGTGRWLLADPTFKHWEEGIHSSLCCLGMPGAGKTVMSAMVIRHLSEVSPGPDNNVAVAFVYFKYDERGTQSKSRIIGGLVKQLLSQAQGIRPPALIDEAFKKRNRPGFQTPYQDMLQAAVESFKTVYLVIDALDEADLSTGRDLISAIRLLPRDKVRFLVTSRPIPEVLAQFDGGEIIDIRASDEDITSYAKSRLPELPNSVTSSRDLQDKTIQAIIQSTQGMFLLAKLNMDSLKDKRRRSALIKALDDLPSGHNAYGAAYDNAMRRISNQSQDDQELARQVLTWVVYAKQPLTTTDLETALAVEVGRWTLDPDNMVSIAELVSLCAGLVTVDESIFLEEAGTVRLVHYTTQEYFSRNEHHLLHNPHRVLSDVCISYLGLEEFAGEFAYKDFIAEEPWSISDWVVSSHADRYPFLRYAAQHWENHCEAALPFANDDEERHTLSLDLRLLTHSELMESYLRVGGKWVDGRGETGERTDSRFYFKRRTGIQYAAGRGNYQQVSALLKLGHNPNDETYGTTPLFEAAAGLHESVVRLLIDAKANKHMALSAAILSQPKKSDGQTNRVQESYSSSGQALESMVTLLLEAGTDPDYTTKAARGVTVLMHAAERGLDRIVAKLCSAGADMDCKDDLNGWTALHRAVYNGDEGVIKQLLRHGCDPDIPDKRNRTPARFALSKCNWTMLEMLLDTGSIALDRDLGTDGSIFTLACGEPRCPVSLLRRMAAASQDLLDKRPTKLSLQTPLLRVAATKNVAAMEMLLKLGANVHVTDASGDTALHVLAKLDDDPQHVPAVMMQALLRAKMDVDAKTRRGVTALMLACKTGDIKRFELLLEEGASVLMTNNEGWSALTFATRWGHRDMVTWLLRSSTLPQIDLDRALMVASTHGHCNFIRALIRAGANSKTAAEDQTTALMFAARGGHLKAARLLIKGGAAVNARKADGTSSLLLACSRGFKKVTRLLLDNGATVNLSKERWALVCLMMDELGARFPLRSLPDRAQGILPMLLKRGLHINLQPWFVDTELLRATHQRSRLWHSKLKRLWTWATPALTERRRGSALLSSPRVRSMDSEALQSVLGVGAHDRGSDKDGRLTLALASMVCRDSRAQVAEMLLDVSARVDRHDHDYHGKMALMLATSLRANTTILETLLDAGLDPYGRSATGMTTLMAVIASCGGFSLPNGEAHIGALTKAGVNVDAADNEGNTALMYAAERDNSLPSSLKILLAAGATPNLANKAGETALMKSATSPYEPWDKVNTLLDARADVNAVDGRGRHVLHWAVESRYCRLGDVIEEILRVPGVILDHKDDAGDTALVLAERNGNAYGAKFIRDAIWKRDRT